MSLNLFIVEKTHVEHAKKISDNYYGYQHYITEDFVKVNGTTLYYPKNNEGFIYNIFVDSDPAIPVNYLTHINDDGINDSVFAYNVYTNLESYQYYFDGLPISDPTFVNTGQPLTDPLTGLPWDQFNYPESDPIYEITEKKSNKNIKIIILIIISIILIFIIILFLLYSFNSGGVE